MSKAQRILEQVLDGEALEPGLAYSCLLGLLAGGHVLVLGPPDPLRGLARGLGKALRCNIRMSLPRESTRWEERPSILLRERLDPESLQADQETLGSGLEEAPGRGTTLLLGCQPAQEFPDWGATHWNLWDGMFSLIIDPAFTPVVERAERLSSRSSERRGHGADLVELWRDVQQIWIPRDTRSAIRRLPDLLQANGWSGNSEHLVQSILRVSQACALFQGESKVDLLHVDEALQPVLTCRWRPSGANFTEGRAEITRLWKQALSSDISGPRPPSVSPSPVESLAPSEESVPDEAATPFLHKAYLSGPATYQAPESIAPDELEEHQGHSAPKSRRAWALMRQASRLLLTVIATATIVLALTAVFPRWPHTLHGAWLLTQAEMKLKAKEPESALTLALEAEGALEGTQINLLNWREAVQHSARHAASERWRLELEGQAKLSFLARNYELAAQLYRRLADRYPELPEYHKMAVDARKRVYVFQRVEDMLEKIEVLESVGRHREAQELVREGLMLAPDHPELNRRLREQGNL